MTPTELAKLHPYLYHVTTPGAWENIKRYGLLSTSHILNLFNIIDEHRIQIETTRRITEIPLEHVQYGRMVINDNVPLTEKALLQCLDDGLTPSDWLRCLNSRVFFWSNEENLNRHLNAKLNRERTREVLVVDTLSFAEMHARRIEISPINSGATIRKAARRGLQTFTPLLQYSYEDWQKLRGFRDKIREITIHDSVVDIKNYVVKVYHTE